MGVDQPQCGAGSWQGQPRKMVGGRILANKTSQNVDRRAVGCNLVVLKSALPQANCKIQAPFSATPVRAIQGACVLV
jgi:hypothetical protein